MAQCQLLARVLHAETTRRAGCPLAPEHGENKNSCANRARIKACPAHKVAAGLSPYRKLAPQLACPSIRGPPETTNCGDAFFHDWHLEIFENPTDHATTAGFHNQPSRFSAWRLFILHVTLRGSLKAPACSVRLALEVVFAAAEARAFWIRQVHLLPRSRVGSLLSFGGERGDEKRADAAKGETLEQTFRA